jgi:hypothetical protein
MKYSSDIEYMEIQNNQIEEAIILDTQYGIGTEIYGYRQGS